MGPGWQVVVHPDDAPASVERWNNALSGGSIFDAEYRLRRSDGVYRWHIGRNVPLKDDDGKVISWFGSATDIEDLKTAQRSFQESEARLRVTMESVKDYAIITTGKDGIINAWNTGAFHIFGYTEQEAIGQSLDMIFSEVDRKQGAPEKERRVAREQGRAIDERWHMRKDGTLFYMSGVMAPIINNQLTGYVKVAQDMTDRKAVEQALALSEERYRVALKSAEMGAWDWNIKTNQVVWNEQHYIMLGIQPQTEPQSGYFLIQFVHREDVEFVSEKLQSAIESSGIFHAEFRIIKADTGEMRWMNGYGRSVASEDGRAARIVGVIYDVTQRKMLEQQKDEFIGIASHELKTPVTSIKAYAEVLQEMFQEANDNRSVELMQKLDAQVDRLTELIKALLDTTKISEGQLLLLREKFDINELIREHIDDIKHISSRHRIVFEAGEVQPVTADRERIGQVLTNLMSNAIKYSPKGGEVRIQSESVDNGVRVQVMDEGIGIPEDMHDKVFQRFFRVRDAHINTFPGMGLGLYITAGIIYRHGGTINVENRPEKGTVFSFFVPYSH